MRHVVLRGLALSLLPSIGLFVLYGILPLDGTRWMISASIGVVALLTIVPMTVHNLRVISTSDRPILAAVSAICLLASTLIVGFAIIYYAMSLHTTQFPAMHTRVDAMYFTVVTLGTVGYGDIVPTGQTARVIVTIQIAFNLVLIGSAFRVIARAASDRRQVTTRSTTS